MTYRKAITWIRLYLNKHLKKGFQIYSALELAIIALNTQDELNRMGLDIEDVKNLKKDFNRLKVDNDNFKRNVVPYLKDTLRRANSIGITLSKENQDLKAENERLLKEQEQFADLGKMYSEVRTEARIEAVKEFAEKAVTELAANYSSEYCHWIDDTIENVKKEMMGEK